MQKPHPEIDGPRPPCFTFIQWHDWQRGERHASKQEGYQTEANGYCTHCTPWFQAMQKAAGTCSHPEVEFVEVQPGEIIGVRNRPVQP